MTIGERITELRKSKGITPDELAEQLGVSVQSVSEWEMGVSIPDTDKAISMSRIFGVTADFLLTGESNKSELSTGGVVYNKNAFLENAEPATAPITEQRDEKDRETFKLPNWKTLVSIAVTVCLLIGIMAFALSGRDKNPITDLVEDVEYTYVLVHGMGGWGENAPMNDVASYWGSSSGSISAYLRTQDVQVVEVTVGPFSSAWDRACELYAQLTGTKVDYGEAHSKEHGHARFGRTYTEPLVEKWDKKAKINLIGHSFGGNTIRLLTSLLEYGSEAEKQASPDDCSPLFEGGKGNYVNSVTTLASPHNGSTLFYCLDEGNLIELALSLLYTTNGIGSISNVELLDFQLEHFGISSENHNTSVLVSSAFGNGKDNAFYDLSPHGAIELNSKIKIVESVYYFSYSYCTTTETLIFGTHVPTKDTMGVLMVPAGMIGAYTNKRADAQVIIDDAWLPNDGLVNVISAQYPTNDARVDYSAEETKLKSGQWYVFPTLTGDHGTPIGMKGNTEETRKFYMDHIAIIDNL
ncbi:MAG: helix-turn-helix domain-containing protein [Clostridia bacterium]|nr:helix-turn-helix domain-containing protein [Clostridia bacterium]